MVTSIILSNMKKSIDLLLRKLEEKHVSKHIVCPSASFAIKDLTDSVENAVEIIDERSAGYIATGMCEEMDEPVVVWCADNDAYRNLTSALTEAYYRKLPILVIAVACVSIINQSTNPYDTIRYYANNSTVGSKGVEADVETAIDYLFADVKGPVFLSLGSNSVNTNSTLIEEPVNMIDATAITAVIPSDTCLHLGYNIACECGHFIESISRKGHCTKDGNLSMLIGSSVVAKDQLHIGIFTSDEVAYDLNMLGNRHVGNNLIVFSVMSGGQSSAINNFANRMAWECRRVAISEMESLKGCLVTSEKPQYIEVEL